jgi:hypothetical protein
MLISIKKIKIFNRFFSKKFTQKGIIYYMRQDNYITHQYHPVCINLEPIHFEFLAEIAMTQFDGNYSNTIYYLLNRYLNQLYKIRTTPIKRTETASYQPKTLRYRRKVIKMNPVLWSKLFEMRHFIGYSISALIRILLDWEMQQQGYDIIPLIPMPNINLNDTTSVSVSTPERHINNYYYLKQGFYDPREIFCIFLDEFH